MAVTLLGTVIADGDAWGQNVHLYERTSDPTSTAVGDWWYRSDIDEFRAVTNSSGTISIPAIVPSNAGSGVSDYLRATTSNGERAVPLTATGDAAYPMFQIVTADGTSLGVHDAATIATSLSWTWDTNTADSGVVHESVGGNTTRFGVQNFVKDSNNPILGPTGTDYDQERKWTPTAELVDGTWRVMFTGKQDDNNVGNIGLAEGSSLTSLTPNANNPVFTPGSSGAWDDDWVAYCSLFYESGTYNLFYAGSDGSTIQIGRATSTDLVNWTRDSNNPVVTVGTSGDWDEDEVRSPCVRANPGGGYVMLYSGGPSGSDEIEIGLATSSDLSSWTKESTNPVLSLSESGYALKAGTPTMRYVDGLWRILWGGQDSSSGWRVNYATSPDLIEWDVEDTNPVITPSGSGWDSAEVGHPGMVVDGGTVYALFDGNDGDPTIPDADYAIGFATASLAEVTGASDLRQGYSANSPLFSADTYAYWPLQERNVSTASDVSGNNRDASITNATPGVLGVAGQNAYSFTGDGYLDAGDVADGLSGLTVSVWVKPDTLAQDTQLSFLSKYWDGTDRSWLLTYRDDSGIPVSEAARWLVATDSENQNNDIYAENAFTAGEWTHILGTWGASSDTLSLYVDGAQVTTGTSTGTQVRQNTTDLHIGNQFYDGANRDYFEGDLAHAQIWDRELTGSEAQQVYDAVAGTGQWTSSKKTL